MHHAQDPAFQCHGKRGLTGLTSVILATAPVRNRFVNSDPLAALSLSETNHVSMPSSVHF